MSAKKPTVAEVLAAIAAAHEAWMVARSAKLAAAPPGSAVGEPAAAPPQTYLETACIAALGCLDDPTGGTHVDDMRAAANHLRRGLGLTAPAVEKE